MKGIIGNDQCVLFTIIKHFTKQPRYAEGWNGDADKGKTMVTALIFAGGTGRRMNSRAKPKQFLELHGKPIIIYTLEHFEYHEKIDKYCRCMPERMDRGIKGAAKAFWGYEG